MKTLKIVIACLSFLKSEMGVWVEDGPGYSLLAWAFLLLLINVIIIITIV